MSDLHKTYIDTLRQKIDNWLSSDMGKASKWGQYIRYTPDLFHLLVKLTTDKSLSDHCKSKLAAAISYFVSPNDFIPEEFWGAVGFVDDITLAAYVIHCVAKEAGEDAVTSHWDNERDIIALVNDILSVADEMVGKKWLTKIEELVNA